MKKIFLSALLLLSSPVVPVLAASKPVVPAKVAWKPVAPAGYSAINWVKAPGIASFFRAPAEGGAIDYLTRIYLPQNQIGFIVSTSTPTDLSQCQATCSSATSNTASGIDDLSNLSFRRIGAEAAKSLSASAKFIWNAPFFNMKSPSSDLSMAAKYSFGTTTTITRGSRSVPDMAEPRRMLLIDNRAGRASISDFDSNVFMDRKLSDQAIEGFAPTVPKADSAARLFLGVSEDGKELLIYCSRLATVGEASEALTSVGVPVERQLQADGGGSTACGYNLPGQFFVEPMRSLPMLMGAETVIARTAAAKTINVRKGPSTKHQIAYQLSKGEAVTIFEESDGWYRIGIGEWILKTLIKI